MRRSLYPVLDSLEDKALLAASAMTSFAPRMMLQPPIRVVAPVVHPVVTMQHPTLVRTFAPAPVATTPAPSSSPSSTTAITATLTTDKASYNAGDKVTISLTETNTSNQAVTIQYGPSVDGFSVTQNGATVWRSNAGMQPMFIQSITLQPGQSHTFTSIWNDLPNSNASPGGIMSAGPVTGTLQVNANFKGLTVTPVTITIN
jgi:Intracellular proteinase inhibitor